MAEVSADERCLDDVVASLVRRGARRIYAKLLAPNDNSRNQPYLSKGSFSALNIFPVGPIHESSRGEEPAFFAPLDFYWLGADGDLDRAPGAQLIAYPAYPEVRLSGFLRGTRAGPRGMAVRSKGRGLLLGVTDDSRVVGAFLSPESRAVADLVARSTTLERQGVLFVLPLPAPEARVSKLGTSQDRLLRLLGAINRRGWIESLRLNATGILPCTGTNCGGCTLEAMLGIVANSVPGPDFEDWEVKGHGAKSFSRPASGRITLMTPGPTGGVYKQGSVVDFVTKYGYPAAKVVGRINFSSPHRVGVRNKRTGLTAVLSGYDPAEQTIAKGGYFALVTDEGEIAISWDFSALIQMWTTKHAKTAFVPYMARKIPSQQYAYGDVIMLAEGADILRFLQQLALGHIAYDPGTWILNGKPGKARSQFRVPGRYVPELYETIRHVRVPNS